MVHFNSYTHIYTHTGIVARRARILHMVVGILLREIIAIVVLAAQRRTTSE